LFRVVFMFRAQFIQNEETEHGFNILIQITTQ
jgi:hypothetical protein